MSIHGEQVLMRIYLDSADRPPHSPTFEELVRTARKVGLAGATILRGIVGFGSQGVIGRSKWSLVEHVPVILEIVDSAEHIQSFLAGPVQPDHAPRHDHARTGQRDDVSPSRPGSTKRLSPGFTARTPFDRASNHSERTYANQRNRRAAAGIRRRFRSLRRQTTLRGDRAEGPRSRPGGRHRPPRLGGLWSQQRRSHVEDSRHVQPTCRS